MRWSSYTLHWVRLFRRDLKRLCQHCQKEKHGVNKWRVGLFSIFKLWWMSECRSVSDLQRVSLCMKSLDHTNRKVHPPDKPHLIKYLTGLGALYTTVPDRCRLQRVWLKSSNAGKTTDTEVFYGVSGTKYQSSVESECNSWSAPCGGLSYQCPALLGAPLQTPLLHAIRPSSFTSGMAALPDTI